MMSDATQVGRPGRFEGKIALITGSSSGIGEEIARGVLREGGSVMLHGRTEQEGTRVLDALRKDGLPEERLAYQAADLADVEQCRKLIAAVVERFGGLDILINNAGDFTRGFLEETSVELWDRQMAVNLRAPFLLTQGAVPLMRARGGGSIVNTGSVCSYTGPTKLVAYSASKGGLTTFTRNAASALSRDRIRVNQVNPGWTNTAGEDVIQRIENGGVDWLADAEAGQPFGRLMLPSDIAAAVLFFASSESGIISGAVLDAEQYPLTRLPN